MDDATCCPAASASTILRLIAAAIRGPANTVTAVASVKVAIVAPRLNPRSEAPASVRLGMLHSSKFGRTPTDVSVAQLISDRFSRVQALPLFRRRQFRRLLS
jgi:hypothetical protein